MDPTNPTSKKASAAMKQSSKPNTSDVTQVETIHTSSIAGTTTNDETHTSRLVTNKDGFEDASGNLIGDEIYTSRPPTIFKDAFGNHYTLDQLINWTGDPPPPPHPNIMNYTVAPISNKV